MRHRLVRYHAWLMIGFLVLASFLGAWAAVRPIDLPDEHEFNVLRWELKHLPNKWVDLAGRWLLGRLSPEEEDARLVRYLLLSGELERLERRGGRDDPGVRAQIEALRRERDALENDVETTIEGRLTAVLEELDLRSSLPFFPGTRWVWPPVDFELDHPPRVLVVSPRARIELVEQRPLDPGLTLAEIEAIEAAAEADGRHAALVLEIAGAATYPSVVAPRASYAGLVETVAHEWVHQYLFFQPLGQRFFASPELRTLNETVANMVGKELAQELVARYPLPPGAERALARFTAPPSVDVDAVLRQLRLDVEALLAQGRVEAAEALMEERRRELAAQGVFFRRINQAFFAFEGLYADEATSTDPVGPKLAQLRAQSASLADFLRTAAHLTSEADLDAALGTSP